VRGDAGAFPKTPMGLFPWRGSASDLGRFDETETLLSETQLRFPDDVTVLVEHERARATAGKGLGPSPTRDIGPATPLLTSSTLPFAMTTSTS
jgi:hypothetical protein